MKSRLNNLTIWQKQLYSSALLQRMLPNYRLFSESTGCGDNRLLENQLDLVWQKLSGLPIKFNSELQLEKLSTVTPEPTEFDIFVVYPALDVCTGMECLLSSFLDKNSNCAEEISQLSIFSVVSYLEFLSEQGDEESKQIETHPLTVWEREVQDTLYDIVLNAKANKDSCNEIKKFAVGDRISNIGVDY